MIKHVKSNHHPASPHVPLLVLLRQLRKEHSLQPCTILLWQPWLAWIMLFSISSGYFITNMLSDTFIMIFLQLSCAVLKILNDNLIVWILFFETTCILSHIK